MEAIAALRCTQIVATMDVKSAGNMHKAHDPTTVCAVMKDGIDVRLSLRPSSYDKTDVLGYTVGQSLKNI